MSAFGAGSNGTLGTGIDVNATVDALMAIQTKPEDTMKLQQQKNTDMITALQAMNTQLSALSDSINSLGDFISGAFSLMSASSSNSSVLTATADAGAAAGTHTITVSQLATISSTYADPVSSGATLADGTFSFTVGGVSKSITINSSNNTLAGLAAAINKDQTLGVTASVLQGSGGATLALVSKSSGLAGAVEVTSAPSIVTGVTEEPDGTFSTNTAPMKFNAGTQAQDAKVTIDGVPLVQSSNTLTGVIPGVTLSLWSDSPQTISLNVSPDTASAAQAIQSFITNYNNLIGSINTQFTANASTNSQGVLAGDPAVKTLQSQLLSMVSYRTNDTDKIGTLRSIGIEMNNDGTLSMNASTLSSVLQNDFDKVKDFFQDPATGFGTTMKLKMIQLTSPTRGLLTVDINGLNSTNQSIADSIQAFEVRMASMRERLLDQYNKINATMQQFPALMQSISSQLSSLETKRY